MKKTFKVIGSKSKSTTKLDKVVEFLNSYFTDTSVDLGIKRLNKEFVKYDEENGTSKAGSYLSVNDIQCACFLASEKRLASGVYTIIVCDDSNNTPIVRCIEYTKEAFFSYFEKNKKSQGKQKTTVDAMEFITNYITKHEEEIDIGVLIDFLTSLKTF